MTFKSDTQRRWMYANEPQMAARWQKETPKGKDLPERVSKRGKTTLKKAAFPTRDLSSRIAAIGDMLMKKRADLQTLDQKGISLGALSSILNKQLGGAMNTDGMQMLASTAKWRKGRLKDELRSPLTHLKKPKPAAGGGGAGGGDIGQMLAQAGPGPAQPGSPMPPSNLMGMFGQQQPQQGGMMPQPAGGGMTTMASAIGEPMAKLRSFVERMTKRANGDDDEGGAEHEAAEEEGEGEEGEMGEAASVDPGSISPEIQQQLLNFIAEQGQGITDDQFHGQAEALGLAPDSAEAAMYRVLAHLLGGQNDILAGGEAAGKPTSEFPQEQIDKGTKIEMEHTPNPAVAAEISKDHLVEEAKAAPGGGEGGMDYYDDLKRMEGTDKRAAAYQYGFFRKIAEVGQLPSEVAERIRDVMEKQAVGGTFGGAVASKVMSGVGGLINALIGAGKFAIAAPLLAAPIIGGLGGWAHYNLTKPPYEVPTEIKHLEHVALLRRLSREARQKSTRLKRRRLKVEGDDTDTEGGDAHRRILPMSQTAGIDA